MTDVKHLTMQKLEAGLDDIRLSPKDGGVLALIVRRPQVDKREVLTAGELDVAEGLVGDNWRARGGSHTADGAPPPDTQITLMNARVAALVAQDRERWQWAGDQLYVDLDLSAENLPPGTRLEIGSAVIEVTAQPHTGCKKFVQRFGLDALKFVNSPLGKKLRLRGLYAKVIQSGTIQVGDIARKITG